MTRFNATGSNIKPWLIGNCFIAVLVWISAIVGQLLVQTAGADEPSSLEAGVVWAWGGDGMGNNHSAPVKVAAPADILAIAGGGGHSLAVRLDGTVLAWGFNFEGQLGDGTTTAAPTPVQTVGLSNVIAVAAGDSHSLALRADGTVWGWGYNGSGQLGDGTSTTPRRTPVQTVGLGSIVAIAAGDFHSLALRSDGTVWAWGSGSGAVGDGTLSTRRTPVQVAGPTDVVAIAAGRFHSLAVCFDGTVWAWGQNTHGQLGDGTTIRRLTPAQLNGLTDVVAVAGGISSNGHSLALRSDGTVWSWGSNSNGQLGDGTTDDRLTPFQIDGLTNVIALTAGQNSSFALLHDGTVTAWGWNGSGQLGDGTTTDRLTPVQTSEVSDVLAIAAGRIRTLAIVRANTPPVAVASIVVDGEDLGDFVELPCEGRAGTTVTLNASNSSDPDGDEVEVEWSVADDSGIVIDNPSAAITDAIFPLGVHQVTLTVYDLNDASERKGQPGLATVTIIVMDDQPPVALVTTNFAALWPPNKTMIPIELLVVASDHCVAPEDLLVFCTITSSQPDDSDDSEEHVGDVDGHDGYTTPVEIELFNIGQGEYAAVVNLRAERAGDDKAGRIYSINVEAIDDSENVGYASTTVVVPHNQGKQQ